MEVPPYVQLQNSQYLIHLKLMMQCKSDNIFSKGTRVVYTTQKDFNGCNIFSAKGNHVLCYDVMHLWCKEVWRYHPIKLPKNSNITNKMPSCHIYVCLCYWITLYSTCPHGIHFCYPHWQSLNNVHVALWSQKWRYLC